ncbi:Alpha-galactosidase A precursor [Botrimarina colliarenosi]|uniref:Alpha-galactosidase n=1 Tax=Botrimarina colliarenosi TaxID=2528001 RepID=A0A5C6AEL7_9BACT|nr:family 43 glycosylhydrolase [Botrimarina colliarenosi]TWT97857.1 Alpha-galactosidase A precursor [Botrimarina colliarenosi]
MLSQVQLGVAALLVAAALPAAGQERPLAPTPPMGWNSWDCYGSSVTEEEVRRNAEFMAEHLADKGWEYVVVDIRWTVQNPSTRPYNQTDPQFTLDDHGRLVPAPNRFPSSEGGAGFEPLADDVHSLGLKFGIHLMRGMPRAAVEPRWGAPEAGYPIETSAFTTLDVPLTDEGAVWLRDMRGVRKSEASQAYFDSMFRLYASWGVDFVKVDDLNNPYASPGEPNYYRDEIEMLQTAIERCGRPIVLSTSPGPTPLAHADHIASHADLWRVSNDFWDEWGALERQFRQLHLWTPYRSPGHWPDGDMLPLGRLAIRGERGGERSTRFSSDEQRTLMTAWCIAQSPLMFGGDLPTSDPATIALISNSDVLKVNQRGSNARQLLRTANRIVWSSDAPDNVAPGGKYVAVFNLNDTADESFPQRLDPALFDLSAPLEVRDLWTGEEFHVAKGDLASPAPPHGSRLFLVTGDRAASAELGTIAAKPLYTDPVFDGAADPVVVWNPHRERWWMYFTNRRANQPDLPGVSWVHGTPIGIAESDDGGATWTRVGDLRAEGPGVNGEATFWAPEVVTFGGKHHLFLTVVPGVFNDWGHPRRIVHLTSDDLQNWRSQGPLDLASDRVIDACVYPLPDGGYRLWYNNERDRKSIYYADSEDLFNWTDHGEAVGDQSGEGPKVFRWRDAYWMVTDVWDGLAVYRSDDLQSWRRQPENLLRDPGRGDGDRVKGGHPDVVVENDRAYLFYFTHPGRRGSQASDDGPEQRRSLIQVVELTERGGTISCDRDKPTRIRLTPPDSRLSDAKTTRSGVAD